MPGWFLVFWLVCVAWAIGFWVLYLRVQQRGLPRAPLAGTSVDRGTGSAALPVLDVTGGGRFGWVNYTMPLVRLRTWEDGVFLSAPGSKASFRWTEVRRAALVKPLIPPGRGVEFELAGHGALIFWGRQAACQQVLDEAARHGVPVNPDGGRRI